MKQVIQFLSFDGCPLAAKALSNLDAALARDGLHHRFRVEHIDIMDPGTPEGLRRRGSPAILLHGDDLMGAPPGDAVGCRLYDGPGGVPSADQIAAALLARVPDAHE